LANPELLLADGYLLASSADNLASVAIPQDFVEQVLALLVDGDLIPRRI